MCLYKIELFKIELFICIKMDLALDNLQGLIYHKTQPNQSKISYSKLELSRSASGVVGMNWEPINYSVILYVFDEQG